MKKRIILKSACFALAAGAAFAGKTKGSLDPVYYEDNTNCTSVNNCTTDNTGTACSFGASEYYSDAACQDQAAAAYQIPQ